MLRKARRLRAERLTLRSLRSPLEARQGVLHRTLTSLQC